MAAVLSISYDPSTNLLNWTISGLGGVFQSSNYLQAGICLQAVTGGQSAAPSSIIHSVQAPSYGYGTYVSGSVYMDGYNDATYTIYGYTQIASNWTYWPVDPVTVHVIKHWLWNESNGVATAAQTQAAYHAVAWTGTEYRKVSNFSYLVWNDLCDKVYAVVSAVGTGWWTNMGVNAGQTPTYYNTRMTASDKRLTAARFNAIRGNIGGRVSTGVYPVSPGEKVMGSYFTACVNALNSWIDSLN